jgi:carbon monoxide dehydrogenase subunit G
VEFVGKSKVMHVVGEHELEEIDGGTRLTNRFVVDGKVPGVERFFKRNMEAEFDNLEDAIRADLGL